MRRMKYVLWALWRHAFDIVFWTLLKACYFLILASPLGVWYTFTLLHGLHGWPIGMLTKGIKCCSCVKFALWVVYVCYPFSLGSPSSGWSWMKLGLGGELSMVVFFVFFVGFYVDISWRKNFGKCSPRWCYWE